MTTDLSPAPSRGPARRPVAGSSIRVPAGLAILAALVIAPGVAAAPVSAAPVSAATHAAANPGAVPGPVVLIGTGGLRWDDLGSDTPALTALSQSAAIGTLAVRSVRSTTCPVDGWLAVSAGRRAADEPTTDGSCRPAQVELDTPGGVARVSRWSEYRTAADAESFDAEVGLLGRTLQQAAVPAAAVGPGAAIALADGSGQVRRAWPGLGSATDGAPGGGADDTRLADDVQAALSGSRLVVVDVGSVVDPDSPGASGRQARDRQVLALDTRIGLVLGVLPPQATVLVASLADSGASGGPHLQVLAAAGPTVRSSPAGPAAGDYSAGLLGTRSTRQDALAQTTDLLPTLLAALAVPTPTQAVGSPLRQVATGGDASDRLQRVNDLELAAQQVRPIVAWFFNGMILAQLLLYAAATRVLRRDRDDLTGRGRVLRATRRTAVVFATVPAATFLANLVPWWRTGVPLAAVTAAVVAFVVPIAALALLGPWRDTLLGPWGVVGAVTALVLGADVATGSHLVLSSLMGVQPLVAGRFYGFSNPGFALFATGSLLAAVAAADALIRSGRPRGAVAAVAGIGVVAVVIDGTPGLGSDFGGPPALIPAFAVLGLLVAGIRLSWRRAVLIAVVTVLVITALSVLDWLRPTTDQTHLGRFVQTVLDGGAWSVIERKARQNLAILIKPISILLPFAIAFVALVLARPAAWGARPLQLAYDRSPVLRHGMISFAVLVGLGFALNDSGTAIPAVAATVAIPLLIAVSVRALELDDERRMAEVLAAARAGTKRRGRSAGSAATREPRRGGTRG